MPEFAIDEERLNSQTKLFYKVIYITNVVAILFGLVCYFMLNITELIPFLMVGFGVLNFINLLADKKHKNTIVTYNIASVMAMVTTCIITLYSGGISSSFIFMMAVVAFGGYATNRKFGDLYLYLTFIFISLIFSQSIPELTITKNVIPQSSQHIFDLIAVCFVIFTLGNVFGKTLLKAQNRGYKSRKLMAMQVLEKENLLKEVHHRVKNNLQTVSSLLSLQSRNIGENPMKGVLKSTQNRVIAMAMVHEMLYMREDISHIEYKSYVQELCEYLMRSVKEVNHKVKLNITIPTIQLGIDTAIPLGLLINEVVTNALKYGVKPDEESEIYISLQPEKEKEYVLRIGDNGIGFPESINYKTTNSLGLKLIHNLSRQLRGTVEKDLSLKGTHYIIRFKEIKQEMPPSL